MPDFPNDDTQLDASERVRIPVPATRPNSRPRRADA